MWGHSEFPCRQHGVVCNSWSWLPAQSRAVAACGAGGNSRGVVGQEGAGHGGCSFEGTQDPTRQGGSRTLLSPISSLVHGKSSLLCCGKLPNHAGQPPTWDESCCHCLNRRIVEGVKGCPGVPLHPSPYVPHTLGASGEVQQTTIPVPGRVWLLPAVLLPGAQHPRAHPQPGSPLPSPTCGPLPCWLPAPRAARPQPRTAAAGKGRAAARCCCSELLPSADTRWPKCCSPSGRQLGAGL